MSPPRKRADVLLVERGLFESRARAQAAIEAGLVTANDKTVLKASEGIAVDAALQAQPAHPFVSRGGVKLTGALEQYPIDIWDHVCLDVGASTGGFTDCMLQRGAIRVAAVDVAYGQIDARLRKDRRVIVVERQNGRSLAPADLPFLPSLATIDVSFISLTKILPAVAACRAPGGEVLAMVKPQFELEKGRVGRGVVRDPADRQEAILKVALAAGEIGLTVRGFASSRLPGPKGNHETFVWCGGDGPAVDDMEGAIAAADEAGDAAEASEE